MAYKTISAKFDSKCKGCGLPLSAGDTILWESLHKTVYCEDCGAKITALQAGKAKLKAGIQAKLQAMGMPKVAGAAGPYASITDIPNVKGKAKPVPPVEPKTQKGKGIRVLQGAGLLGAQMAIVCQTEAAAVAAFHSLAPARRFARPCPTEPRHGFVDSREVQTEEDVRQVWAETRAADPAGEVIVMPLIEAEFNCVWRPGLLAVGPGHDGATAGHGSISVQLTPDYGQGWKDLAEKAGVKLDTQAPFIEAVSHKGVDLILTQIRGGVKDCPTEPDWVPAPMTVGMVICKDGKVKADPDAMLAWETEAKTLTPGFHIVYDEGGNLADHWSVHAQLNGIAVVTTFKPTVGQTLPKMGVDLVPFEPQAVIWGALGALVGPSLKSETLKRERTRATVAAILGTHHGLRQGGEAGVHLGASVGLFLRLAQAAVWGEARHAPLHSGSPDPEVVALVGGLKGKSRQQIFTLILDDWAKGRAGLRAVTRCFHGFWGGGFGGKAWAAIGHATVNLDAALVNLIRIPSQLNVKRVLGALTTAVNLAHNGVASGCFLNKFCSADWFDRAAALDPQAAIFAGPVWYQAAQADPVKRMALLEAIEGMSPIEVGFAAPQGNVLKVKAPEAISDSIHPVGGHHAGGYHAPKAVPTVPGVGKVGIFSAVRQGESTDEIPGVPVKAYAKAGPHSLHLQIALQTGGYVSGEVKLADSLKAETIAAVQSQVTVASMSGSGADYKECQVTPEAVMVGGIVLLTVMPGIK